MHLYANARSFDCVQSTPLRMTGCKQALLIGCDVNKVRNAHKKRREVISLLLKMAKVFQYFFVRTLLVFRLAHRFLYLHRHGHFGLYSR